MKKEKLTLQLTLTVTYLPNGVPQQELQDRLEKLVSTGMGDGLLTGDTKAEVDTHSVCTTLIPQPVKEKKEKKAKGRFHEGTFRVLAHRVTFWYRLPPRKRIDLEALTAAAMDQAEECICNEYVQGELNYETEKFQATGWWGIERN